MERSYKKILRRLLGPILFLGLTIGIIVSCSNSECFDNQNSLPLAGFYSSGEAATAISIDSISIYGIGAPGDSILQDSVRSLSEVYLPFRIDQESTTYVIRYLAGIPGILRMADTITFKYNIKPTFVSSACGTVYYYEMDTIETTHFFIDSVSCPRGTITNANIQNLRIYFRVDV